jgi:hypothetical protein
VKLGLESRNKTIAAAALMVVALALFASWFFGSPSGSTPASPVASAATPTTEVTVTPTVRKKAAAKIKLAPPRSIDPTLRFDWLRASEDTKYAGNGRNIFEDQAPIPAPIASPIKDAKVDNTPPPPPPPPPILLKFYGFANAPGETKKIFLSQGEDVFIAREGDIVDRRYRVLHITPMAVEIEDVLNNNRQSIPLTQG